MPGFERSGFARGRCPPLLSFFFPAECDFGNRTLLLPPARAFFEDAETAVNRSWVYLQVVSEGFAFRVRRDAPTCCLNFFIFVTYSLISGCFCCLNRECEFRAFVALSTTRFWDLLEPSPSQPQSRI